MVPPARRAAAQGRAQGASKLIKYSETLPQGYFRTKKLIISQRNIKYHKRRFFSQSQWGSPLVTISQLRYTHPRYGTFPAIFDACLSGVSSLNSGRYVDPFFFARAPPPNAPPPNAPPPNAPPRSAMIAAGFEGGVSSNRRPGSRRHGSPVPCPRPGTGSHRPGPPAKPSAPGPRRACRPGWAPCR